MELQIKFQQILKIYYFILFNYKLYIFNIYIFNILQKFDINIFWNKNNSQSH